MKYNNTSSDFYISQQSLASMKNAIFSSSQSDVSVETILYVVYAIRYVIKWTTQNWRTLKILENEFDFKEKLYRNNLW